MKKFLSLFNQGAARLKLRIGNDFLEKSSELLTVWSSLLMASNGSRNLRIINMNEMKKAPNQSPEKKKGKAHVPFPSALFQTHLFSWYSISILFHGNMNSPGFLSL